MAAALGTADVTSRSLPLPSSLRGPDDLCLHWLVWWIPGTRQAGKGSACPCVHPQCGVPRHSIQDMGLVVSATSVFHWEHRIRQISCLNWPRRRVGSRHGARVRRSGRIIMAIMRRNGAGPGESGCFSPKDPVGPWNCPGRRAAPRIAAGQRETTLWHACSIVLLGCR